MLAVCDLHAHIYPCYNLSLALRSASQNLQALTRHLDPPNSESECLRVIALVERFDCSFYRDIRSGKKLNAQADFEFDTSNRDHISCSSKSEGTLCILPGRQVVSAERLEILALGVDLDLSERLDVMTLLQIIRESGGLPVVNWAPGKWSFQRGRLVGQLIERAVEGRELLILGDTALRPNHYREPSLMLTGRANNLPVIAGSDPLPFPGEERRLGSYGVCIRTASTDSALTSPLELVRRAVRKGEFSIVGQRLNTPQILLRLLRNEYQRRLS